MKILYQILLFCYFIIHSSCTSTIDNETRILSTYDSDSLLNKTIYHLQTQRKNDVIVYQYIDSKDSSKNLKFSYAKKESRIYWGPFTFYKNDDESALREFDVKLFQSDDGIIDAPNDILFSEGFGIIQFDNGMELEYKFEEVLKSEDEN